MKTKHVLRRPWDGLRIAGRARSPLRAGFAVSARVPARKGLSALPTGVFHAEDSSVSYLARTALVLGVWLVGSVSGQCFFNSKEHNAGLAFADTAAGPAASQAKYGGGEVLCPTDPMAKANRFRFSTKYQDEESDLLYYGYRYYNPSTGRWLSRDPIAERGGQNLYGFVGNNSINYIDPLGLQIGAGYGTMPLPHFPENNDPPPTWVTLMPIAGSGAQASYDFKQGNWGWGMFNLGLAATDIVPVRSATTGLAKGGWKFGGHTWDAVRKWLTRKGCREFPGQEMHHWAIPREGWGSSVPEWLKNQPWNLRGMPNEVFHDALHGVGQAPFNFGERLWFGTPDWFKAGAFSFGGREANWMFNPGSFTAPSDGGAIFLGPVPSNP